MVVYNQQLDLIPTFKPWGHPANWRDPAKGLNQSPEGFGGPFPGGANILFADGSVRFIKNTINPTVFRALATMEYRFARPTFAGDPVLVTGRPDGDRAALAVLGGGGQPRATAEVTFASAPA